MVKGLLTLDGTQIYNVYSHLTLIIFINKSFHWMKIVICVGVVVWRLDNIWKFEVLHWNFNDPLTNHDRCLTPKIPWFMFHQKHSISAIPNTKSKTKILFYFCISNIEFCHRLIEKLAQKNYNTWSYGLKDYNRQRGKQCFFDKL